MGYPPRLFQEDTWYHVYTRGQREEPLYFAPVDRIAYISFLDRELSRRDGFIGSYCLMTNHVHLLIKMETTPLDEIFQTAHMKYAKYFNAKRDTSGHVFQGRPGMKMVLDDSYLESLVGYIHQNPVEAGIVETVTDYQWSSWRWFLEGVTDVIASGRRPPRFIGTEGARRFRDSLNSEFELEGGNNYWGSEDEWEQVERRRTGREGRKYKERRGKRSIKEIVRENIEKTDWTVDDLKGASRKRDISALRQKAMCELYEEGYNPTEIAKWFNRTPSAVTYARKKQSGGE